MIPVTPLTIAHREALFMLNHTGGRFQKGGRKRAAITWNLLAVYVQRRAGCQAK